MEPHDKAAEIQALLQRTRPDLEWAAQRVPPEQVHLHAAGEPYLVVAVRTRAGGKATTIWLPWVSVARGTTAEIVVDVLAAVDANRWFR